MRKLLAAAAISVVCLFAGVLQADTRMSFGISADSSGLNDFYFGVSEYNRVPQAKVVEIRRIGLDDEQLPVVFFLAQRAGVAPEFIIRERMRGASWMSIALRYNLSPEIFYMPVQGRVNYKLYKKSYGYYGNGGRKNWRNIRLTDMDIINLVNLKFVSERYGYDPNRVMRMRSDGRDFVVINRDIRVEKKVTTKGYKEEWKMFKKKERNNNYDNHSYNDRGNGGYQGRESFGGNNNGNTGNAGMGNGRNNNTNNNNGNGTNYGHNNGNVKHGR